MVWGARWVFRKQSSSIQLLARSLSCKFSDTDNLCDSCEGCYQTGPTVQQAVTFSDHSRGTRKRKLLCKTRFHLHKNNLVETVLLSTCSFHARPLVVILVWRNVAKTVPKSRVGTSCLRKHSVFPFTWKLFLWKGSGETWQKFAAFLNGHECLSVLVFLAAHSATRPVSPWPYCVTHSSTCMLGSLPYSESFDLTRIGSHLI